MTGAGCNTDTVKITEGFIDNSDSVDHRDRSFRAGLDAFAGRTAFFRIDYQLHVKSNPFSRSGFPGAVWGHINKVSSSAKRICFWMRNPDGGGFRFERSGSKPGSPQEQKTSLPFGPGRPFPGQVQSLQSLIC